MVVTPDGRAYVDAYDDHFDTSSHRILLVTPERDVAVVARDVVYPNGITTTPDGTTLLVAETFAGRITVFDGGARRHVGAPPDVGGAAGRRASRRAVPRRHGDVWVASYLAGEFLHVRAGGEVLDRIAVAGRWAMSCCLGGDDGRSLLLCTAETTQDDYFAGRAVGHLDVARVDAPGVERP